jgi:small neutral amino acid transporter SnatA (MarC family)
MTRAVKLLLASDWRGSVRMHPLAVPMLVAGGAFALSTVWITYARGAPLVHEDRWGRASLTALAIVYLCVIALWILRWAGYFGGPVPVY